MEVIYRYSDSRSLRKHNCPDCEYCQLCSDTRCNPCRSRQKAKSRQTMADQIEQFEKINCLETNDPRLPLYLF
jgi:hypothetical protein